MRAEPGITMGSELCDYAQRNSNEMEAIGGPAACTASRDRR